MIDFSLVLTTEWNYFIAHSNETKRISVSKYLIL